MYDRVLPPIESGQEGETPHSDEGTADGKFAKGAFEFVMLTTAPPTVSKKVLDCERSEETRTSDAACSDKERF